MWPFHKKDGHQIKFSNPVVVAIVLAVISLAISAGVARWSWLILDEQIQLRNEVEELKARQDQVGIQYEFWLNELEKKLPAEAIE
ncbi:hypothetical protein KKF05_03740 [Patescibacteria group bacterium]|nr:hypothetical protein [Patescibacteria group bacterium]MBU1029146.1 hypothetical protein [Patescibacteria group bacterium]MBU1916390.1 hypothetical protein [Patescibacteria group bacterium]